MAQTWGPLHALHALLAQEDHVVDGEKDRKQTDLSLARVLGSEDMAGAIQAASLDQLDLALAHDALAVERKPFCYLALLGAKASKMEQWAARRITVEDRPRWRSASARLVTQVSQFLFQVPVYVASKEIRRVSQLCVQYVSMAVDLQQGIKAVFPLRSFLRRFHQHGNTVVTPIHTTFFYLCVHAKCYAAAMDILNQPLFELHPQSNLVSAVDFLGYAYYGGLLYLGAKRYQDAIDFFSMAVTAPAVSLSAFVVEAYKKLVLASLILKGDTVALPKYTPFVVTRHIEMHCGPYVELSHAFTVDRTVQKLASVVEAHASTFVKDGNLGLAKQVIEALKQRKLLLLPRTYVTIALGEVTKAAELDVDGGSDVAAEKLLLQLVSRGDMAAVIDKQKRMVKFVLDDDDASPAGGHSARRESEREQSLALEKLQAEMEKLLRVSAQLRAVDTEIVTSAKFQSRVGKDKDRRQRAGGGNQGGDVPGFDPME